jgi:hypothetical protein
MAAASLDPDFRHALGIFALASCIVALATSLEDSLQILKGGGRPPLAKNESCASWFCSKWRKATSRRGVFPFLKRKVPLIAHL